MPNIAIKVLQDGKSCHGGRWEWSLPAQDAGGEWLPGEWTPYIKPELCFQGWHLTRAPARWWEATGDVRAYLAEYDGEVAGPSATRHDDSTKFAVGKCRLLRPLTDNELFAHGVFLSGTHQTVPDDSVVGGTAQVQEILNARVLKIFGQATVRSVAGHSSILWMGGSATVNCLGGNATINYLGGQATVDRAVGHAIIRCGKGSAVVTAMGTSQVVIKAGTPTVHLYGRAAVIDYRDDKCVVHTAPQNGAITILPNGTTEVLE